MSYVLHICNINFYAYCYICCAHNAKVKKSSDDIVNIGILILLCNEFNRKYYSK